MGDISELIGKLRQLAPDVTPGPWRYRPERHDDWGVVRGQRDDDTGSSPLICQTRLPYCTEADLAEHRAAKTDPWENGARWIALLSPDNVLAMADEIDRLKAKAKGGVE